ncbi:hypothetical protein JL722_6291 [Aureococcus anophagefferens]|nr:hypothetical protein JL722_6291 [Aureococcus anophagefferens]
MRASDRLRLLGPSEHGSLRSAPQQYGGRGGEPGGVWSAAGALLGRSKQWYRERQMDLEIEQSPLESRRGCSTRCAAARGAPSTAAPDGRRRRRGPGLRVVADGAQQAAARPAPGGDDADADRRFDDAERRMRQGRKRVIQRRFNLARVDAEWAAYESRLKQEVDARLGALDARRTDAAPPEVADHGAAPRQWRDKEKQSRLVHTAPVFEPDAQQDGAMPKIAVSGRDEGGDKRLFSNGSQPRAVAGQGTRPGAPARPAAAPSVADDAERQVAELRKGYAKALDRVEFQKANAKKWIHRQKTRMTIQIDACDPVCRFLASRVAAATESDGSKARQAAAFDARIKAHLGATRAASEAAAAQAAPSAAAPRSAAAPGLGPGLPLQNHAAFPAHDGSGRRRPPTSDAVVRGGGRSGRRRRPNTSGAPSRGRVRGGFSPIHNAGARKGVDASGLGEASMKATPLRMHVRAG